MFVLLAYLVVHERNAYFSLRKDAAQALMAAVSYNLEYSLLSEEKLKEQLKDNLLSLASYFAGESFVNGKLDLEKLISLSRKFNIFKLVVLDKNCKVLYVSKGGFGRGGLIKSEMGKVCKGEQDYYIIGFKQSYRKKGYRFGVVKRVKNGGAIVLMADATYLHNLFSQISFIHVLNKIVKYRDIEYVRFEKVDEVVFEKYNNPEFFKKLVFLPLNPDSDEKIQIRVVSVENSKILEVSKSLVFNNKWYGCLRFGLSLSYIELLDRDFLLLTIVLFVFIVLLDGFYFYSIKQTEKLYEETAKFSSVLNQIEDGILIRQKDRSIFCNKAVFSLIGDKREDVLTMKDGFKTFDINGKKIFVVKNSYSFGEVFIIRDVTLEEASKESKEREKRIFSMGKLASSFAHEIRNPLNTISMIIQQIAFSEKMSDDEKEMIDIIKKEIERLNSIVKEFMEVSTTPDLKLEKTKISSFIKDIELFYKRGFKDDSKKIKLTIENDFFAEIDVRKFKGVIINLIQNSFEANAKTVEIVVHKYENMGIIEIIDDGVGMSKEEKERAFDLYFTTKTEGSGLGLPYVQRMVSLHGGFVKLETEKGKGTKFQIYLPLKEREK